MVTLSLKWALFEDRRAEMLELSMKWGSFEDRLLLISGICEGKFQKQAIFSNLWSEKSAQQYAEATIFDFIRVKKL